MATLSSMTTSSAEDATPDTGMVLLEEYLAAFPAGSKYTRMGPDWENVAKRVNARTRADYQVGTLQVRLNRLRQDYRLEEKDAAGLPTSDPRRADSRFSPKVRELLFRLHHHQGLGAMEGEAMEGEAMEGDTEVEGKGLLEGEGSMELPQGR